MHQGKQKNCTTHLTSELKPYFTIFPIVQHKKGGKGPNHTRRKTSLKPKQTTPTNQLTNQTKTKKPNHILVVQIIH